MEFLHSFLRHHCVGNQCWHCQLLSHKIYYIVFQYELTMSSGLLTAAPVGLATEAVDTTLPGTVAWTAALSYGGCDALL